MAEANVRVDRKDLGIAVVSIDRPKALNALNTQTLLELRDHLHALGQDSTVRVIVLTGGGEKAFVAGADIAEMQKMSSGDAVRFSQVGHEVTKLLELVTKPTIAAVNGFALGGGTELAIACDFIIASETAIFGQPEVCLGVIPGFGGTVRLSKFVGVAYAKDLIFSGRRISATEAKAAGLVSSVLPKEGFLEAVLEQARAISKNSAYAIARAKLLLNDFSEMTGLNTKLDAEAQVFGQLFHDADQKEGMAAFLEKRPAKFKGLI